MVMLASTVLAQTVEDTGKKDATLEEIVVTGTLIRGIPPGGSDIISVPQESVREAGVSTTAQLLQTIPQLGSFNNLQSPSGGFNTQTSNRPNLRNLPGFTTAGGSPTLVLLNGHRLVGMGISTTTPDPDIVPPAMIERVEIVPDGGSAIYGSDAVAGVINFITRKDFEGVKFDGHYGAADNYDSADGDITAGHRWDGGSAYASYNYSQHDAIFGRDRDYVRQPATTVAGIPFPVTSLKCSPSNVQPISIAPGAGPQPVYAMPYTTGNAAAAINSANQCDETDVASIYPKEHRHAFFVGGSQHLGDSNELDVHSYYMDRKMNSVIARNTVTSFVGPAFAGLTPSPFQADHLINPISATNPFEIHQVSYTWGPPDASKQRLSLTSWGITPTLTTKLGGEWQLRTLANYGESKTEQHTRQFNATVLANAIAAGVFNPYDPESSDPAGLNAVTNSESFGINRQRLLNVRTVADGALFALPGGEVKLAAGLEYSNEKLKSQKGNPIVPGTENTGYSGLTIAGRVIIPAQAPSPIADLSRNTKSAFAELSIPVVGKSNGVVGVEELTVSTSGRYDDYSDFGDTFNPKFGITYKPLDWVKLRGAWGKSFVAPSLADDPAADLTSVNWVNLGFLLPPASLIASGRYPAPVTGGTNTIVVLGNAPGIKPETAKTWSAGIDLDPPAIPGLHTSLTYWNINFKDLIALPSFTNQIDYWSNYGSTITVTPSVAQINTIAGIADSTAGVPCGPLPNCLYAILDARKKNFGTLKLNGLDLTTSYVLQTGFGSVDFGIYGNYELSRKAAAVPGASFAELLDANTTRLRAKASMGANIENLRAQISLNHTQGYKLNPAVGPTNPGTAPQQTRVGSYDVVGLFFEYDMRGAGWLKDLSFTLNVDNVFDRDPPRFEQQSITLYNMGYANGNTLGRFIQFGVGKQF
jgi:iron complex outermembrane receptor protein